MNFYKVKEELSKSFQNIPWIAGSGLPEEELKAKVQEIEAANPSRAIAKAKTFILITERIENLTVNRSADKKVSSVVNAFI